jgi:hypothetical protein
MIIAVTRDSVIYVAAMPSGGVRVTIPAAAE